MQSGHSLAMQASNGIIPRAVLMTGCKTPKVIEKISYEHYFNSRLDPSHPIKGRRHGSFMIKLIIQEIIIEKCQNCALTQTFRLYNPSLV